MSAVNRLEFIANGTSRMPAEVWMPEDISIEALRGLFETAMFDVRLDADGDLVVRDHYRVFVTARKNRPIRFVCVFGFRDNASEEAKSDLCRRINERLIIIRASVHEATLVIDWYLPTRGGVAKKAIVMALRQFSDMINSVGEYDTDDVMQ
jgi:hypothetical protein